MTKFPNEKAAKSQIAIEMVPPLILDTLAKDAEFHETFDLVSDAIISFDDANTSVQRSELYNAIRKFFSGISIVDLTDKHGQMWELQNICKEGGIPKLQLSSDKQKLILPINYAGLSPDRTIRLCSLKELVLTVNLPSSAQEKWGEILSNRSLEDDEMDMFYNECHDTPVDQAKFIRAQIIEGNIHISSLIPTSRRYYERLIGTFDGSASISEYASGNGRTFLKQLSLWQSYNGFIFSLLLSSHSALTAEINTDQLSSEELVHAFEFLDQNVDIISKLGAIEVGLRVLSLRPELEPFLIRLIERLRDEDAKAEDSGYNLIASVFILVDGELSKIRLFSKEPPFYRRLAALSQAGLIYRQLINSGINIGAFCKWAFDNRGEQYYLQSLADMRMEPCWNPDLAEGSQIKADFLGRIVIAAKNCELNIKTESLYNLIFGNNSKSIYSLCQFPYSFYPGPLEGAEDTPKIFPEEISKMIEAQLNSEEITAKSFIALVNSAMIFQVRIDQAELAAKVLELGNHRLTKIENRYQLLAILNGLAIVAAITRSHLLADKLRILIRIYRHDPQYALSIREVMRICLIAVASRKDLKEWRDFTGEWLTELAFSDLSGDDGEVLYSHLRCLCHAVPDLWVSCGRAEAALMAYNSYTY